MTKRDDKPPRLDFTRGNLPEVELLKRDALDWTNMVPRGRRMLYEPFLHRGRLHYMYSPRGVGKSTYMWCVAREIAKRGEHTVIFDLENPDIEEQLVRLSVPPAFVHVYAQHELRLTSPEDAHG